jgi:hypothetical protein
MTPWILGTAIVAACAVVLLWRSKAVTHPADALVKQAISMGWQKESEIPKDGYPRPWAKRSVRLVRDDDEAVAWYQDATVTLIRRAPLSFDDFVELERWLATHEADDDDDEEVSPEIQYYRDIERFVVRQGHFEDMVAAEGTDEFFCKAVMNFRKAGYLAQEDAPVIAMITLEALLKHRTDRQGSILFMVGIIKQFADGKRQRSG